MTVEDDAPISLTSPMLHITAMLIMAAFAALLVLSWSLKVEIVARGQGRVVPANRAQVIQPEFAGRVIDIYVRDGDPVRKAQPLMRFDGTDAATELASIERERERLNMEKTRLTIQLGLLENEDVTHPHISPQDEKRTQAGAIWQQQKRILAAEIANLKATLVQIDARERSSLSSEEVTKAEIMQIKTALSIQQERLDVSTSLLDSGSTSSFAHLDVQEAYEELRHRRAVASRSLALKISERNALATERRTLIADRRSTWLARKAELEARMELLAERTRAARRRVDGITLRAPVDGTVDRLQAYTIGAVFAAGQEVMRIIPDGAIEVETTFTNADIGFLHVDQKVNIRLDAYPSERFGFLEGQVSDVASDSVEDAPGQWGFRVTVRPESSALQVADASYSARPGMTGTVDVITGRRRLIEYFFEPIVKTFERALGER